MTATTTLDDLVVVRPGGSPGQVSVHRRADGRFTVRHGLDLATVDDDLAERLAEALAPLTDEHGVFTQAFVGIVSTCAADPDVAWLAFYRNSLSRVDDTHRPGYAQVYLHALRLLPRSSVLDLGCGFGFLALRLAHAGVRTVAADVDPGTVGLLTAMAGQFGLALPVIRTNAAQVPLPDDSVDAVALLHVLEHVDAATGDLLLREAMRIARRQVVVAVPYEQHPTGLYGHVRSFDSEALHALGVGSGRAYTVHEHCGGWLVVDTTHRRQDASHPRCASYRSREGSA